MKVDKAVAVALFQSLGRKTADKWTPTVLQTKLNALKDEKRTDLRASLQDKGYEDQLDEILDALEKGGTIEVEGEGEAPHKGRKKATGAAKDDKGAAAGKGNKKATAARQAATVRKGGEEKRQRDRFGSFVGGGRAAIGKALSKKPQTMRELMDKAGVKRTYYDYLDRLVDQGEVVRDGKTFALAGK